MKLGLDLYSVRSQGWSAMELLDYCRRIRVNVAHFGLEAFPSLDDDHLRAVKRHADELGLDVEMGIGSICETSPAFRWERGNAVEQLTMGLRAAELLGSPVLRCLLGSDADRRTEVPLETHIQHTIAALRAVRDRAMDLGIMLAMETHADLQGWEMRELVEEAGPEFVGVCIDSGNPVRLHEDPMVTLEHLAPYVVTSHIRDSAVWSHPRGAAYQWVAMGDGNVGIEAWAARYRELCPQASFTLEILTGTPPRVLNYLEDDYWRAFPRARAHELARFERLVRRGQPFMGAMVTVERGVATPPEYEAALVAQQRHDVERSVLYCREVLGIGE